MVLREWKNGEAGKAEYGEISIGIWTEKNLIKFSFSDDGKGLNLSRIYRLGKEKGILLIRQHPMILLKPSSATDSPLLIVLE